MFDTDDAGRKRTKPAGAGVVRASSLLSVSPAKEKPESMLTRMRQRLSPTPEAVEPVAPIDMPEPVSRPAEATIVPVEHARTTVEDDDAWRPLVDPATVIMGIVRSRWIILCSTVAGAALGVLVAVNTPKLYEAATDLLINPSNLQLVERELSQSGLSSDAALALIQNQMRIITSGNVFNKVVDRLDLLDDPEFNGSAGGFSLNPMTVVRGLLAGGGAGGQNPDLKRAITVDNLSRHVSVSRDNANFFVTIWARSEDAGKAATIANAMSAAFLDTSADFQAATANRATSELTGRLDELRRSVEEAERAVQAFKSDNGIVDAQGRLITDDEIVRLNDQLSTARARTAELRARAASAGSVDVDAAVGGVLPEQVNSGTLSQLLGQYGSLRQEADRLAVRLGPRHPQRLAADVQVQSARQQIAAELRRINASVQIELTRAEQLEKALSDRLDTLKSRQNDLSGNMVSLRELERDATSKRAVYESYLLRSRETGEQENLNTDNIRVVSEASAPLQPSGMSRSTIVILGLILGFAAGVGLGALRGIWQSLSENTASRGARRRRNTVVTEAPRPAPVEARFVPPVPTAAAPLPVAAAHEEPETVAYPWTTVQNQPAAQPARRRDGQVPPLASYAAQSARRFDETTRRQPPANTQSSPIAEIRESLREFRAAVDDLAESRRRPGN